MDRLQSLCDFFDAIEKDGRIGSTHICIYAALLSYRAQHGFANPIHVFSHEIMRIAKIASRMTYYRCVRELSDYGYIMYKHSFKKTKASRIYFMDKQYNEGDRCRITNGERL